MTIKLQASVAFQAKGSLEEIGGYLSKQVFGGLPFGGKDACIHEEIPAVFIGEPIMGMQVVLDFIERRGMYILTFAYDPEVTDEMSQAELEQCAFFQRGFEQYMRKVLARLPGLRVVT